LFPGKRVGKNVSNLRVYQRLTVRLNFNLTPNFMYPPSAKF